MEFSDLNLNNVITIIVLIAQAGIVYYRLKKVEQTTERFNELFVEFAVHKNSLKHHRQEFEKQSLRIENVIQKLDERLSGIEAHAYEAIMKNTRRGRD